MNNSQEEITLLRDVSATLIPHGEEFVLTKGDKVTITHLLGGNYTVMTLNGMYRIAAKDADALGKEKNTQSTNKPDDNAQPASEEEILKILRLYLILKSVNVDLGLIYKVLIEETEDRGRAAFVDLTLTAPGCGMGPVIAEDVKNKVLELPGINDAEVEIVWDPPWTQDMMSEEGKWN